jgi:hypothetical protein
MRRRAVRADERRWYVQVNIFLVENLARAACWAQARCMVLEAHLLKVEELPPREDYRASWLVSVLDMATADTFKLAADAEVARSLVSVKPLTLVALRLSCRRVPSERGAAYKLRVVGADKPAS